MEVRIVDPSLDGSSLENFGKLFKFRWVVDVDWRGSELQKVELGVTWVGVNV